MGRLKIYELTKEMLDPDLAELLEDGDTNFNAIVFVQILRELRNKGPEEKSRPIGGFLP